MKLNVGMPDINAVRINANMIQDKESRETILQLCNTVDALIRNIEAMINADTGDLNEQVLSVQDLIDRGVIKQYEIVSTGKKSLAGPFKRRN